MYTNKKEFFCTNGKVMVEAYCLSTDTKPTTGIANGSILIEMDTQKIFMFDETNSTWLEIA